MEIQTSAVISSAKSCIDRRSANYHPSIWGDRFLSYKSDTMVENAIRRQLEELKLEISKMLTAITDNDSLQKLQLIATVQRLGLAYHFEIEISDQLEMIHHEDDKGTNLYRLALRFRLLRQQGFNASCEVFSQFKNDEGNFRKSLIGNVQGMLELYEASHLRVNGEDILDEALDFTMAHLESTATMLKGTSPFSEQIFHALKHPIHKGLPRIEARRYISFYQEDSSHNKTLLKMAKLDFNLLQLLHKKELSEISRWWKDLNFATKLTFARDRMVECYFWILSVYFEPKYSFARKIMTKVINLASVLDDIYDVYGTLEELTLFTQEIERWDISITKQLPECMKLCYQALQDVFVEMEKELAKTGNLHGVHYAKEAMKKFVQSYYIEAKWLHEGYVPTMEEYMSVGSESCGYPMLTVISFIGMGEIATKEAFEWVSNKPIIVRAASTISRLMDDIVSYKLEKETGKIASSIECYKRQFGATEEEACNEFCKHIVNAWKDINKELLRPTIVAMPLLMRPLNLSRVMDVLYKDGDNYTNVGKVAIDGITSSLVDPIPI